MLLTKGTGAVRQMTLFVLIIIDILYPRPFASACTILSYAKPGVRHRTRYVRPFRSGWRNITVGGVLNGM